MKPKSELICLLSSILEKPPLYLGANSILRLRPYIDGWLQGRGGSEGEIGEYRELTDWMKRRLKMESSYSWELIIFMESFGDDAVAMATFGKLLEEFLDQRAVKNP